MLSLAGTEGRVLGRQEEGRALPRLSDSAWEGFNAEQQFPAA